MTRRVVEQHGRWAGDCFTFSVLWQMQPKATAESLSNEAKNLRDRHRDYLGEHLLGPQQQAFVNSAITRKN